MGQIYTAAPRRRKAVCRAIEKCQESLKVLADHYAMNPKTLAKWKKRSSVFGQPTGPKQARSTVLSIEEEACLPPLYAIIMTASSSKAQTTTSSGHTMMPDASKGSKA